MNITKTLKRVLAMVMAFVMFIGTLGIGTLSASAEEAQVMFSDSFDYASFAPSQGSDGDSAMNASGIWELEPDWRITGAQEPEIKDGKLLFKDETSVKFNWKKVANIGDFDSENTYIFECDMKLTDKGDGSYWGSWTRAIYVGFGGYWDLLAMPDANNYVVIDSANYYEKLSDAEYLNQPMHVTITWEGKVCSVKLENSETGAVLLEGKREKDGFLDMTANNAAMTNLVFRCEDGAFEMDNFKFSAKGDNVSSTEMQKTGALSGVNFQNAKTYTIHFSASNQDLTTDKTRILTPVTGEGGYLHNDVAFSGGGVQWIPEGNTNWIYWDVPGVNELGIKANDELKIYGKFTDGDVTLWITPTVVRCTGLNDAGDGAYWEVISSQEETEILTTGALSGVNFHNAKTYTIHFSASNQDLTTDKTRILTPVTGEGGYLHNGNAFSGGGVQWIPEGNTNWIYWDVPGVKELGIKANDELKIYGKFTDGEVTLMIEPTVVRCTGLNDAGDGAFWEIIEESDCFMIETTVKALNSATKYISDKWYVYLNMNGDFSNMPYYKNLSGLTYSINDGEKKAFSKCHWEEHDGGTLFFELNELPQDITENTKITISGSAKTSDGKVGIKLTTEIIIYVNDAGWSLDGYLTPIQYIQATVKSVNYATGYLNNKWYVYLDMNGDFSSLPYYKNLSGFTYSINDGEKKSLSKCHLEEHGGGTLFFELSELPKDITENTKVTISGKGKTTDGKGVQLTQDIILYVNDSGWSTTGYMKPIEFIQASAKSVNHATKYLNNKWYIYLDMYGDFSDVPYDRMLRGFEYSINGGEKKTLKTCSWQSHDGGTLLLELSELPKNITGNTKITVSGKIKTSDGIGIELVKEITLYANEHGFSLTDYPKPVYYIQASAKSLNYATKYLNNKWYIYLNMEGDFSRLPFEKNLMGFEYSINGGEKKDIVNSDWEKHEGGTLLIQLPGVPENITENTIITISGKARTNEGVGVQLIKDIVLYGNQYGVELGKYKTAPVYTDIEVTGIDSFTGYVESHKGWYIYLTTDKAMPGEKDRFFKGMSIEVGGKQYNVDVQHASHRGTLSFFVKEEWLSKDVANGAKVVLKAGKGLQQVAGIGINLKKDVTLYKFYETMTLIKPTTNTKYTDITFSGLTGAIGYNKDSNTWAMELKPYQTLPGEEGTNYYYLNVVLNGKKMTLKGKQQSGTILITIPRTVLPEDTKTATLTIKAGSKAVGGHGNIGIHVKEDLTVYLFNGIWSDEKFDKVKETELFCTRFFNYVDAKDTAHLYFYVNSEFPGKAWYNKFSIPVDVDGKTVNVRMYKSDSSIGRILYLGLSKKDVNIKEGTLLTIKGGTVATSGGYKITITKDFQIIYTNGMWLQNRQSDVQAPKAQNIWDIARFEKGYIPVSKDGTVMMSGEDEYNEIISSERMMDFTVSFSAKKIYDDATSAPFSLILRGTPISNDDPMSITLLNGYVITFDGYEYTEETHPNNPELWGKRPCHINIWKNGVNESLRDQYCIGTYNNTNDCPYFKYNEAYEYKVSIYNIEENVACIELWINGRLVYKCYDEAGVDPADPAINPGNFSIYGVAPTIYGGDTAELETVIAEKTECYVGEYVGVAVTYPSVLEDAEFTVDKEGATIESGEFKATKAGTYTITATYKGKSLKPIKITVTEKVVEADDDATFSIPPAVIIISIVTGVLFVAGGTVVALDIRRKKKLKRSEG